MAKTPKAALRRKKEAPEEREALLQEARVLKDQWSQIRDYLLMAFQNDPITEEQERAFFELRTAANRGRRIVAEKLQDDLDFGSDRINDFLHKAINIKHLRGLPLADKRQLVGVWHVGSILLHRLVGALEYINETKQVLRGKKTGMRGIRAIRAEAAARRKKSKIPVLIGVVFVAAVAFAIYYFLFASA